MSIDRQFQLAERRHRCHCWPPSRVCRYIRPLSPDPAVMAYRRWKKKKKKDRTIGPRSILSWPTIRPGSDPLSANSDDAIIDRLSRWPIFLRLPTSPRFYFLFAIFWGWSLLGWFLSIEWERERKSWFHFLSHLWGVAIFRKVSKALKSVCWLATWIWNNRESFSSGCNVYFHCHLI